MVCPVASVCEVYCPVVCLAEVAKVVVGLCYVCGGGYAVVGGEGPPVVAVVVSPECCHCVSVGVACYDV